MPASARRAVSRSPACSTHELSACLSARLTIAKSAACSLSASSATATHLFHAAAVCRCSRWPHARASAESSGSSAATHVLNAPSSCVRSPEAARRSRPIASSRCAAYKAHELNDLREAACTSPESARSVSIASSCRSSQLLSALRTPAPRISAIAALMRCARCAAAAAVDDHELKPLRSPEPRSVCTMPDMRATFEPRAVANSTHVLCASLHWRMRIAFAAWRSRCSRQRYAAHEALHALTQREIALRSQRCAAPLSRRM